MIMIVLATRGTEVMFVAAGAIVDPPYSNVEGASQMSLNA